MLSLVPLSTQSALRSPAIVAKSGINLELKPAKPRKLLTSDDVVGQLASSTARTFSTVGPYPEGALLKSQGQILLL